jgi:hypothetical protein
MKVMMPCQAGSVVDPNKITVCPNPATKGWLFTPDQQICFTVFVCEAHGALIEAEPLMDGNEGPVERVVVQ